MRRRMRNACVLDDNDRIDIDRRMGPDYFDRIVEEVELQRRRRRRKVAA